MQRHLDSYISNGQLTKWAFVKIVIWTVRPYTGCSQGLLDQTLFLKHSRHLISQCAVLPSPSRKDSERSYTLELGPKISTPIVPSCTSPQNAPYRDEMLATPLVSVVISSNVRHVSRNCRKLNVDARSRGDGEGGP